MPTSGQARGFRSNINAYVCWAFLFVFMLGLGLVLWNAVFGSNPLEMILLATIYQAS